MMMKNKMIRALGLSAVAVGLSAGTANAVVLPGNAQVVVSSAITMVETSPLDFGTIAAFGNQATPANTAILTIPSSGAAPTVGIGGAGVLGTDVNIISIIDGSPGIYSVTGAAPNTLLSVSTAGGTFLTDPSLSTTNRFALTTTGAYMTLNGSANTFTTDTDATGALTFQIGGTLATDATGLTGTLQPYFDATYTGTFNVTVTY